MIKYVENHFLDKVKYDLCVQLDHLALPYAESWYLDILCNDWDCLVLNDYDAVWPLPKRNKFGLKYFYRPFGIQQLGIFSKTDLTQEEIDSFILHLIKNCKYADLFLNEFQKPRGKNLSISKQRNIVLNLNRSYEEVYQSYSSNHKRNIKKSQKKKLSIFERDGPKAILELFKNNKGGDLNLKSEFYQNFEQLMYTSIHKNKGEIWSVYGGPNLLLAAAFFIKTKKRTVMLFSAQSAIGKEMGALFYLLNEYIIINSNKIEFLDFEGSNTDSLARFYNGFGAEERDYYRMRYDQFGGILSKLKS